MQTLDLGNNESLAQGMKKTRQGYLCLTYSQSKWLQTERGAINWLAKRGLNPDGTKIKTQVAA